jgi:hypothetical protein
MYFVFSSHIVAKYECKRGTESTNWKMSALKVILKDHVHPDLI